MKEKPRLKKIRTQSFAVSEDENWISEHINEFLTTEESCFKETDTFIDIKYSSFIEEGKQYENALLIYEVNE